MKKKIGEIYNKPIVTGDKNLVTKNEIHEDSLKGGSGAELIYIDYKKLIEANYDDTIKDICLMTIQASIINATTVGASAYVYNNINGYSNKKNILPFQKISGDIYYISVSNKMYLPTDVIAGSGGFVIDECDYNKQITLNEYITEITHYFANSVGYNETIEKMMLDAINNLLSEVIVTEEEVLEWLKSE